MLQNLCVFPAACCKAWSCHYSSHPFIPQLAITSAGSVGSSGGTCVSLALKPGSDTEVTPKDITLLPMIFSQGYP